MKQRFYPSEPFLRLMETFRCMTNDCIRTGLAEGRTSVKGLSLSCYPKLKRYEVPSAYKLCAISKASGILTHYRKLVKDHHVKEPYCRRLTLTTCYGLKLQSGKLRMPGGVEVALNGYVKRFLSQPSIKVRSVTITPESLSISVRKNVEPLACSRALSIDRNLDNITLADSQNRLEKHDLSQATAVKAHCREVKRRFLRNDVKIRRQVYGKYGRLERDCVGWLLHNISASIVLQAKLKRQAIIMEDLRGIRNLYRRGNGQGAKYRGRMNSWSYGELQRQIQYKADWSGIPVIYVGAYGTSARCSMCGHRVLPEENRQLHCPNCNLTIDRDVNAARNILARGLKFKPVGSANEAMVQEPQRRVILKVDADQLTSKLTDEPPS